MPVPAVVVALRGPEVRIEVTPDSPLLEAPHRIFFVNVLGFDVADDFCGFVSKGASGNVEVVQQVTKYLSDEGFVPGLNEEARAATEEIRIEREHLQKAHILGTEAKQHPATTVDVPTFRRTLKPYQIPAVAHLLAVQNAANFSVPGSGKTTIVLAAYAKLLSEGLVDKIVVIGPRSSFVPWEEEFAEYFDRKPAVVRIAGDKPTRQKLLRTADDAELMLLTYQIAAADTEQVRVYLRRHHVMMILDESHNIKRLMGGKWSDAVLSLAPDATRRVILSGTPVPNSLHDLWSQLTFLWPRSELLGSREQFKYRVENSKAAADEVRSELFPLYARIRKSELGLPTPRFHPISLEMKPYQRAIYDVLAAKVLAESVKAPTDRIKLRMWRKARMVRLLQVASNPALLTKYSKEFEVPPLESAGLPITDIIERYPQYETPPKIEFIRELVREIVTKQEKVLIWTAFIHNIETLSVLLSDFEPGVIYGAVPKDESEDAEFNREKVIDDFKHSAAKRILIANPSACAESVSLHKICHHAIYLDRTFNGAHYMQSLDRIHRVGLGPDEQVHYYILQAKESIDEVIDSRLAEKQRRMLALLDDDLEVLNLDAEPDEFSESQEEDADFAALLKFLASKASRAAPR
jgi:SNF2 family DNA or RNA helicase